jgi:hypothetical protein
MKRTAKKCKQMDKSRIKEVMEELSRGSKNRPATARLKDIYGDIEIALFAEVNIEAIWQVLQDCEDYKMPLATFKSALDRIKKERSKKNRLASAKSSGGVNNTTPSVIPTGNTVGNSGTAVTASNVHTTKEQMLDKLRGDLDLSKYKNG